MHTTKQLDYSILTGNCSDNITPGGMVEEAAWFTTAHKEVCNKLLWDNSKTPPARSKASQVHPFSLPVPPRGQSLCLAHSTASPSLRAAIRAMVICAICCVQTIHRHRLYSSHTHAALMAEFQRKTVASCLTHLVCQYCFVSPRTWQTHGPKGCLLVHSCYFQWDTYTFQFKHSLCIWVICEGNKLL